MISKLVLDVTILSHIVWDCGGNHLPPYLSSAFWDALRALFFSWPIASALCSIRTPKIFCCLFLSSGEEEVIFYSPVVAAS